MPGVIRIVGRGTHPEPIPEHEIEAIKIMLRSGLLIEQHPYLTEGERIIITKGPLKGIDGLLIRKKNKLTVVVSIELLQRSISAEFASDAVEANPMTGQLSFQPNPLTRRFVKRCGGNISVCGRGHCLSPTDIVD